MAAVPPFRGVLYVGLSVRDVRRSANWYRALLGFDVFSDDATGLAPAAEGWILVSPDKTFWLGLLQHRSNQGEPFSEFRTGLDHVEFGVQSRAELEAWVAHLDALGIPHSGIKEAGAGHLVTFRDPDNIQLEFFFPTV